LPLQLAPLASAGGRITRWRCPSVCLSVRFFVSLTPVKCLMLFAMWQHLAAGGGLSYCLPYTCLLVCNCRNTSGWRSRRLLRLPTAGDASQRSVNLRHGGHQTGHGHHGNVSGRRRGRDPPRRHQLLLAHPRRYHIDGFIAVVDTVRRRWIRTRSDGPQSEEQGGQDLWSLWRQGAGI